MKDSDKTALYTAVTLLKGVIMERALLLVPDADPQFLNSIENAVDVIVANVHAQTYDRWEWLIRRECKQHD